MYASNQFPSESTATHTKMDLRMSANSDASAIVADRLDYCNSVLYGTSATNALKLQRVQNAIANVITGSRRCDHITSVLADLHWLPIRYRMEYKLALIAFKSMTTQQPCYLHELIRSYEPMRKLRQHGKNLLYDSRTNLNFTKHACCHAVLTAGTVFPNLSFSICLSASAHLSPISKLNFTVELLYSDIWPPRTHLRFFTLWMT